MWDKIIRHWGKILSFFVTVIIPLIAWFGGFIPDFVKAEDMKIYDQQILHLDSKQTELSIEFKRSEREDVENDQLRIEREIYKIKQEGEEVPPFYIEQQLKYDQKIQRLEQDINDLREYRLNSSKTTNILENN